MKPTIIEIPMLGFHSLLHLTFWHPISHISILTVHRLTYVGNFSWFFTVHTKKCNRAMFTFKHYEFVWMITFLKSLVSFYVSLFFLVISFSQMSFSISLYMDIIYYYFGNCVPMCFGSVYPHPTSSLFPTRIQHHFLTQATFTSFFSKQASLCCQSILECLILEHGDL